MKKKVILNVLFCLLPVAAIFAVWAVASSVIDNEYILPGIGETAASLIAELSSAKFYSAFSGTLLRSLISFLISFSLAFIFAALGKKHACFEKTVSPIIKIMRALPTVAVVLLLLFWTNGKVAPVIVTAIVVLPVTYTNAKEALAAEDGEVLEMCRCFCVDKRKVFFKVRLPFLAPYLLLSAGAGLSLNLKLMVAAEVLSQTANSVGYLLNSAKVNFEIADMMALVIVAVIIGVIIESIFSVVAKKLRDKWN